MQSIFRYPGGKSKKNIRDSILRHAPSYYDEYREPMVGGGGIFFGIPAGKKRWINDLNPDLISVYNALKNNPNKFISDCKQIEPPKKNETLTSAKGGKELYSERLKNTFDRLIKEREKNPALTYFFVNRTVWAGRVNYNYESRLYFSNPKGWNIINTNILKNASEYIKNAKITCQSYEALLNSNKENNSKNIWIYLDPPYVVHSGFSESSQLYPHSFTIEDHEKMAEEVKKCKHKVLISYDNDGKGLIKSLYKGFNIHNAEWTYCGTSSANGQSKSKKKGKELIITNYSEENLFSK